MSAPTPAPVSLLHVAVALSLGAAVALGITRFAYGLLLPPMRDALGWSYALSGAMNTANTLGYLAGALLVPLLMRRFGPSSLLWVASAMATVFMASTGFSTGTAALFVQRTLAGVASALVFVAGGVLAVRLSAHDTRRSGLLLGMYYGGTGWGICASALAVPVLLQAFAGEPGAWRWAWWGLALLCAGATLALCWAVRWLRRHVPSAVLPPAAGPARGGQWRGLGWALAGYGAVGMGYIGYMTFVVALLRERGSSVAQITVFYTLLGLAMVASPRLWEGLLDRHRGGGALARLNALLGLAIVVPAVSGAYLLWLASGLLFGAVCLSVVAATTSLVRHNLPPEQWAAGIGAFTVVFALGQIAGPTLVGWIGDGPGGLSGGLLVSALVVWLGALLAMRQRAL